MREEALTSREQEIVARLLDGGRVATIARELEVTDHTVRNHLKAIFWKLDVHSQAELIEKARSEPAIAGRAHPNDALAERLERGRSAGAELFDELRQIAAKTPGREGLKRAVRRVLPLDEARRAVWRDRIQLWNESGEDEQSVAREREARKKMWDSLVPLFVDRQGRGPLRADLDPRDFASALAALLIGAALRMLRDPGAESVERELSMLDEYLEASCRPEETN